MIARGLFACCTALLASVALTACRDHANPPAALIATPTADSPSAPLDAFRDLLDAMNAHDTARFYAALSAEAQRAVTDAHTLAVLQQLVDDDPDFHVDLDEVGEQTVNGDQAQIQITLIVTYRGQRFPLSDVAFMQREDGRWRLADHFLQTALAAAGAPLPADAPRSFGADGCVDGDVLAGVYLPSRLDVLAPCVTVEGVVRAIELPEDGEGDGDLSFDVELSGDDLRLLNDGNRANMHGWLHMEIVPRDRDALPMPRVGDRVRARGPWVLDRVHGHNEVHPVWSLSVLPG